MPKHCEEFSRRQAPFKRVDQKEEMLRAWKEHLSSCEDCRVQQLVDRRLGQAFAAQPVPHLSHDFGALLTARITEEKTLEPARVRPARRLTFYWLMVALASVWMMWRLPLPKFSFGSEAMIVMMMLVPISFWVLVRPEAFVHRFMRCVCLFLR